jgi:PTS system nitrogen regulatory IIA component
MRPARSNPTNGFVIKNFFILLGRMDTELNNERKTTQTRWDDSGRNVLPFLVRTDSSEVQPILRDEARTPMQLTLRQVAEMFDVSENTVTRWVKEENLPVHDVKSQYRFDRAELLEWAATTQRSFSPAIFREVNGDIVSEVSLADALERGGVAQRVSGDDRYEIFCAAIRDLPVPATFDRESLLDLLMAREKSGGTAIGNGIAIPHPRYPVVLPGGRSVVRVCYLEKPLNYQAGDGKPVETWFLMICPTVHEHLQLLARLACVLKSADFLNLLQSRPDKDQLVSAVRAEEAAFTEGQELQEA